MSNLHWSKQYDQDLEEVRSKVLLMGGLVEEQFQKAVQALLEGDVQLADHVIATDAQVNQLEVALDNICAELIVRRQPAAGDLRTVVSAIKVIADIERIGDEAIKVARAAKNLQTRNLLLLNQCQPVHTIVETAMQMLRGAFDAYARLDKEQAVEVIALDDDLDREFHEMMRSLITYMMEEPRTISAVLDILWAAKAIERIGDHATNICEFVVYIVEGDVIRHTDYAKRVLGVISDHDNARPD